MKFSDLAAKFQQIKRPAASVSDYTFSTVALAGRSGHRLGKDKAGNPALLVCVDGAGTGPGIKLEHLSVEHDVLCTIEAGGKVSTDKFTLVRFTGVDDALRGYFLSVLGPLVAMLGADPAPTAVSSFVSSLVALFRAATQPAQESLQGLWAELFLMVESADPRPLAEAWHATPNDRYDFNSGELRLEVKSSGNRVRRHHFSLEQLKPPAGTTLLVASLFVERSGDGVTLEDLSLDLREKLRGEPQITAHVDRVVSTLLGQDIKKASDFAFDIEVARESLRFYEALAIPGAALSAPVGVSEVRFVSDLSSVPVVDVDAFRSRGALFRFLPES